MFRIVGNEFLDWQFYVLFIPIVFLYGICIGSFLNVVIFRLPKNESLIKRSSHCMTCGASIRKRDLVPVFSWLLLRGKCHACGEKISPRYPIVESLNGILYVIALLIFDISAQGILTCIFFSLLVVIAFMDWDTMEMDLRVLGLIALLAVPAALLTNSLTIPQRIIGGICVSLPFFIIGEVSAVYIKKKTGERMRGIEIGDTLLMAAGGLFLGWKAVVASAFVGLIVAMVCGLIYKRVKGESKFPFGPFLAIGLFVGTLCGEPMMQWYIDNLLTTAQP